MGLEPQNLIEASDPISSVVVTSCEKLLGRRLWAQTSSCSYGDSSVTQSIVTWLVNVSLINLCSFITFGDDSGMIVCAEMGEQGKEWLHLSQGTVFILQVCNQMGVFRPWI